MERAGRNALKSKTGGMQQATPTSPEDDVSGTTDQQRTDSGEILA
jgi:hypothetical protein